MASGRHDGGPSLKDKWGRKKDAQKNGDILNEHRASKFSQMFRLMVPPTIHLVYRITKNSFRQYYLGHLAMSTSGFKTNRPNLSWLLPVIVV